MVVLIMMAAAWWLGYIIGRIKGDNAGWEGAKKELCPIYYEAGVDVGVASGRNGFKYCGNNTFEVDEKFIEQVQLGEIALNVRDKLDTLPPKADVTTEVIH